MTLVAFALLSAPVPGTSQEYENFDYTTNGNAVTITRITNCGEFNGALITIPSTINGLPVTAIGDSAFEDCVGMTGVTMPDTLTNIGSYAFTDTGLTNITIPNSLAVIGEQAFFECGRLSNVTIPNTVTAIRGQAFWNCGPLTSVIIPNSVTNIGQGAFGACYNLSSALFQGNAPAQNGDPFAQDNLATVYYLAGTTGWGASFGSCRTAVWHVSPPAILGQPQSLTTNLGATVAFSVLADGTVPLGYQWLFNGKMISETTTNSYTITNVQPANSGGYTVIVTNLAGSATSVVALLVIRPYAATATATVVNGFLVGATLSDQGWGYTNAPSVMIIGGGGSGAQAVAVVSNGVVLAVNIMATGSGYTNAPAIFIAPPVIPQPAMGITALSFVSLTNLAVGTNYQVQCFFAGVWSDLGPAFTTASSTLTQYVRAASGYRLVKTPAPEQAYATAEVANGFVVGATVISGGSGYTTNPAVTIVSNGGGTNATATATVSGGIVTGIAITGTGSGYTDTPTIVMSAPPASALSPTVTQAMELDLGNLSPFNNYQVQFSPVAGGPWIDLDAPFTPTSTTNTQLLNVSGTVGFFRLKCAQ
jgi:hypothetical protein